MYILIDIQNKVVLYIHIFFRIDRLPTPLGSTDLGYTQLPWVFSLLISQYFVIVNLRQLLYVC